MKLTDRKKQQIILASVEEFRENGFSGTSMDNVALRAEVSKRTVYNHFKSKDELFQGIVEYMFGLVAETAPAPYNPAKSLDSQLREIARDKINLFSSDEFTYLSHVVVPEAILSPDKMAHAMEQFAIIESDMEKWFCVAIKEKHLAFESAHDACEAFMSLVKMEAYWPRVMKMKPTPSEKEKAGMIDKVVGMYMCYYAPVEE